MLQNEKKQSFIALGRFLSQFSEEKTETFLRKEYSFGSFTRSFRLPNTVDSDNIEASYEDGVLHLTIPKKEEAKPKEPKLISIN